MDYLLINILGILVIVLTLWWFFGSKPRFQQLIATNNIITILVKEGVYEPSQIKVSSHLPIVLRFLRKDPTPCAETVVFSKFDRSYNLPLNKVVEVKFDPQPAGEIAFTCQMGMYRGKLVVE